MAVAFRPTLAPPTWRIVAAASIGNALEWFDLLVYGYLAVTISRLFFPSNDENASLLLALGTFGVSYLIRPLGALALGAYAMSEKDAAAQLEKVWALFPVLRERMSDIAGNFSGGQQQMLAIARGLMAKPNILVLDEPSLGVAPLLVAEIFRLIVALRDQGITILLAEQNAKAALSIADRGYVFENGRITLSGAAKDLLNSPEIAERYLGMSGTAETSGAVATSLAEKLRGVLFAGDLEARP